ncbi:hypothetical protein ANACAC_02567 [Anaerostipes caccae L1-92]|uniref:Uncharacterized protein n=1 Tax=Anaerostipes caccae (strain DSM 14662 / CCUG 47493 / JCM 13470 / NCIMB 13811 / L1-92) TaxID=411490 RepID=B0MG58_ANACD|nr:hypothetical protein ANACAC_02567 [Anaerostipes caccae L1-92]
MYHPYINPLLIFCYSITENHLKRKKTAYGTALKVMLYTVLIY